MEGYSKSKLMQRFEWPIRVGASLVDGDYANTMQAQRQGGHRARSLVSMRTTVCLLILIESLSYQTQMTTGHHHQMFHGLHPVARLTELHPLQSQDLQRANPNQAMGQRELAAHPGLALQWSFHFPTALWPI